MLDFQRGSKPRNYFSRREQRRLLLLVMALGLVIFLAGEARNPRYVSWLWAMGQGGPQAAPPPSSDVPQRAKPPDGFFPGVKPEALKTIQEDSPFVFGERGAWFNLLKILKTTDSRKLAAASEGRVTYVEMFRQSEEYRGRLVTVRGTMRRVGRVTAPKNDAGIKHYYQTWITPQDDPSNLIVVYCLSLPEGFPTGEKLEEDVQLVGFFFKRWLYQARDGLRSAPVVLAKTVTWHRKPAAAAGSSAEPAASLPLMIAVAALFALVVTGYVYYRTGRDEQAAVDQAIDDRLLRQSDILPGPGQSLDQLAREDEIREK